MSRTAKLSRVLPFLILTVFLDLVGFGIVLPLLPSYVGEMGGSAQTLGVLLASFAAAQFIATPVLGRASDRHGRRRVIVLSLTANAIAMGLFSLAAMRHALVLLFCSRILAGLTSGNISACQAVVADLSHGAERAKAMGKLGAGIGLGVMLGPWIGGRVSLLGDAAPPLFAGAFAIIALVGVLIFLPETHATAGRRDSEPRAPQSLRSLANDPRVVLILSLYFLTFLYMATMQTSLALVVMERFEWGKDRVGDLFGLFGLVTLVVQFVVIGPLTRRVRQVAVVLAAASFSIAALTLIAFAKLPAAMVAGLVVLALGVGLTQPLLAALSSTYAGKEQQGVVLGFAQSSGSLARTVGPLLWGVVYQHVGSTATFLGGATAAACAVIVSSRLLALREPTE